MPVFAVTNQKGGVGKTTTAVNLAFELARRGYPTLLIDADPQGNASSSLGHRLSATEGGTYDVVIRRAPVRDVIRNTAVSGLDILPAGQSLAGAEVELAAAEGRYVRIKEALGEHHYRYVLIDCPPALGMLSLNAMAAADSVIIPVQCEYFALEGLSTLFETLRKVKGSINPSLELLGVVITMFDKRVGLSESVVSEIRKHFPDKTFNTIIPRNVKLAEAPSYGQPAAVYDKWSKGARAYKKFAEEVERAS